MTSIRIICLSILFSTSLQAQDFRLDSVVVLQDELPESSGLLYCDGVLITHNDSGDGAYLYEIDTLTGWASRTVYLDGVIAIDWEDLAADDTYLYIGDFGNNFGERTDLVIYRISWDDYWQSDTVTADNIQFNYAEQTDFTSELQTTAFDAETLIATPDGLYLFTKNWSNFQESKIYRIPKEPGNYTVAAIDSIATPGLLTGLDYRPETQTLLFVGYNILEAFVLELGEVDFNNFSTATTRHWTLPLEGSLKTEGLAYRDDRYAYLTKEKNSFGEAVLYRLDTDFTTKVEEIRAKIGMNIFPNPVSRGMLTVALQWPTELAVEKTPVFRLWDSQGRMVYQVVFSTLNNGWHSLQLDADKLNKGIHFYEVTSRQLLASGRVVVE